MDLKDQLAHARSILEKTETISIPREVMKLHQILNTEEFPDAQIITDLVGQNAILAGEVVQTANLPSMQGDTFRTVETIRDAVDILGLRRLKNLITAIALKQGLEEFGNKTMIDHSVKVANVAAVITQYTETVTPDAAYLLGLFHNIGAIMMNKVDPGYETIFTKSLSSPFASNQMELEQYQTTHGVVGILVAEEWNLSTPFKKTMIMHHDKNLDKIRNTELKQLVAMIQLANALVSERFFRVYMTPDLIHIFEQDSEILNLSAETLKEIRLGLQA